MNKHALGMTADDIIQRLQPVLNVLVPCLANLNGPFAGQLLRDACARNGYTPLQTEVFADLLVEQHILHVAGADFYQFVDPVLFQINLKMDTAVKDEQGRPMTELAINEKTHHIRYETLLRLIAQAGKARREMEWEMATWLYVNLSHGEKYHLMRKEGFEEHGLALCGYMPENARVWRREPLLEAPDPSNSDYCKSCLRSYRKQTERDHATS